MKKIVELPLTEPLYQTYHDGILSAALVSNPSVRNWFLCHCTILTCTKKFLDGYTTPELALENCHFANPHLEMKWISTEFLGGYVNKVIKKMLDQGYYVYFYGIDDYYVPGKSWYKERHFNHDGSICGYNSEDRTYCLYAYDSKWIFRKFWVPQKAFNKGRLAIEKTGFYGGLCAIKPKSDIVEFSLWDIKNELTDYLDSDMEKYPKNDESRARGIVVQEYLVEYVDKLYDGSIPYERMDRRVFRLIWEHKRLLNESIRKIETMLELGNEISKRYEQIVVMADKIRMLYASHHMKRRDSVLPIIKNTLLRIVETERGILNELLTLMEKEKNNDTLENA